MRTKASPHFSESPFDGVGGAHPFAFVRSIVAATPRCPIVTLAMAALERSGFGGESYPNTGECRG